VSTPLGKATFEPWLPIMPSMPPSKATTPPLFHAMPPGFSSGSRAAALLKSPLIPSEGLSLQAILPTWQRSFDLVTSLRLLTDTAYRLVDRRPIGFLANGKLLTVETPMKADQSRAGDDVFRLWDPATGALLRVVPIPQGGGFSFNSRKNLLALIDRKNGIQVVQADTGATLASISDNRYSSTDQVALFPDGDRLAAVREDFTLIKGRAGYLAVFKVNSPRQVTELPVSQNMAWTRLAVSPDGKNLLLTNDGYMFVMDAVTGQIPARFHAGYEADFSYSPDGKYAVIVGTYATNKSAPYPPSGAKARVQIYNAVTWTQVRTLEESPWGPHVVQFTPDSKAVFVIPDKGLHIYDVDSGRLLQRFAEDRSYGGLAFDPSGSEFALATGHGAVEIYRVAR
jgi:WD40 repeat protein